MYNRTVAFALFLLGAIACTSTIVFATEWDPRDPSNLPEDVCLQFALSEIPNMSRCEGSPDSGHGCGLPHKIFGTDPPEYDCRTNNYCNKCIAFTNGTPWGCCSVPPGLSPLACDPSGAAPIVCGTKAQGGCVYILHDDVCVCSGDEPLTDSCEYTSCNHPGQ
jgi:hypothetical protein